MSSPATEEIDLEPEGPDTNRDSLSERIYARLRIDLMTGQYEPGSRLNIRRLAATYDMSPTPVREAIVQLVREGALELRLGHQPRVPVLTIPQYINIRETRAPLERLAAELGAVHINEDDIETLKALHDRFVQSENQERWKEALAANQEFHFTIYRASGNYVLVRCIENLWLLAGPFVNNQYPLVRSAAHSVHPHLLIIDALTRRAPGETGELVVRDLREGSYVILEKIKNEANAWQVKKSRRKKAEP
ncbi:GntR family transcriptional regulator [Mesorhizobium sp. B3-1-3]|uniref:GntR family transcriptional regulator n=1 Tax=unclassified Mesorhizobium TaxID=325217 RepID=UPI00112C58AF|nr:MULTISPECIES: GntR family transcriptional regulator [unclassified Mesorhizobium]TPI57374.1 GntR family transcriptional regulator [Mesorhizobium sp. B3-1-8]TPI63527.1 GntR family transcriptional regulator [Mesorhizobium sp. B3-1-3]